MNKRSVNISSLVILLSLLSFLFEMCLYYFIPQHLITVAVAAIISLGLAHFFLESSLNYDYCFLHASFMTITSTAFTIIVYLMQPNVWIAYDYSLIALIIVNWFIPFGYCFIRDFCDRGPRFAEYLFFFYGMSILFLIIYAIALVKLLFVTPLLPPYETMDFGAHNFIPFMATGNYIEDALSHHASITKMITYMLEMIVLGIPAGFYIRVFLRNHSITPRIFTYLFLPFLFEFIQFLTGIGRADIDDYTFYLIGILVGIAIYYIVYRISYEVHKRDFLEDRTVVKKLWHFQDNY